MYLDSMARKLRFPKHMAVISKNTLPLPSNCDHAAIWTKHGWGGGGGGDWSMPGYLT